MLTEAILLEHNKRLRERVEELEETIRQIRKPPAILAPLPSGIEHLTPKEETIFRTIAAAQGRVVSRAIIYAQMYPDHTHVEEKIVDVMMCRLRKKIAPAGLSIITEWGRGWQLESVNERLTEQAHTGVLSGSGTKAA